MPLLYVRSLLVKDVDLNRYCLPGRQRLKAIFLQRYSSFDLGRHFNDLTETWWIVLASGGFTFLISLAYVYMLRHAAKIMLYMSLIVTLFLMFGGGFYLYSLGELRYEEGDSNKVLLRVFAGLLWGFTGILMVLTLCVWK